MRILLLLSLFYFSTASAQSSFTVFPVKNGAERHEGYKDNVAIYYLINEKCDTVSIGTRDRNFRTPENIGISETVGRLKTMFMVSGFNYETFPNSFFCYKLPSGWYAYICEGKHCTENTAAQDDWQVTRFEMQPYDGKAARFFYAPAQEKP